MFYKILTKNIHFTKDCKEDMVKRVYNTNHLVNDLIQFSQRFLPIVPPISNTSLRGSSGQLSQKPSASSSSFLVLHIVASSRAETLALPFTQNVLFHNRVLPYKDIYCSKTKTLFIYYGKWYLVSNKVFLCHHPRTREGNFFAFIHGPSCSSYSIPSSILSLSSGWMYQLNSSPRSVSFEKQTPSSYSVSHGQLSNTWSLGPDISIKSLLPGTSCQHFP